MVTRRPLGETGFDLPCLSLGTIKFGRNSAVKYPSKFDLPSDEKVVALLEQCLEAGVDLLDTAPAYGISEIRLGHLLPGRRQEWLLSTKAGETFINGQSRFDFSNNAIRRSVEQSLKNLQTDYLDIVLIHSDGDDLKIINHSDAMAALQDMKQAGKIRWIGMSTKTIAGSLAALPISDVLMVALNIEDQSHMPVLKAANQLNCGLLIKKALNSGHAKPRDSLHYVLRQPAVTSVVVGTINPMHLQANIDTALEI